MVERLVRRNFAAIPQVAFVTLKFFHGTGRQYLPGSLTQSAQPRIGGCQPPTESWARGLDADGIRFVFAAEPFHDQGTGRQTRDAGGQDGLLR